MPYCFCVTYRINWRNNERTKLKADARDALAFGFAGAVLVGADSCLLRTEKRMNEIGPTNTSHGAHPLIKIQSRASLDRRHKSCAIQSNVGIAAGRPGHTHSVPYIWYIHQPGPHTHSHPTYTLSRLPYFYTHVFGVLFVLTPSQYPWLCPGTVVVSNRMLLQAAPKPLRSRCPPALALSRPVFYTPSVPSPSFPASSSAPSWSGIGES